MAVSSVSTPLVLGGVTIQSEHPKHCVYTVDPENCNCGIQFLSTLAKTKEVFEAILQEASKASWNSVSLMDLLEKAVTSLPKDVMQKLDSDIFADRSNPSYSGLVEAQLSVQVGALELESGVSKECSIPFERRFEASEAILDYVREKARPLIEEIVANLEGKNEGDIPKDHTAVVHLRLLMALEPYFLPKSEEDLKYKDGILKDLVMIGYKMGLLPVKIDEFLDQNQIEVEKLCKKLFFLNRKISELNSQKDKVSKAVNRARTFEAREGFQLECVRLQEELGHADAAYKTTSEKLQQFGPEIDLVVLKFEVEEVQSQLETQYDLLNQMQALRQDLQLKSMEFFVQLDELEKELKSHEALVRPLAEILKSASLAVQRADQKISDSKSSLADRFKEFMQLASFLNATYSTSLIALKTELISRSSLVEEKIKTLIQLISSFLQQGDSTDDHLDFKRHLEAMIKRVLQIIKTRKELMLYYGLKDEITSLQEMQLEIKNWLQETIENFPRDKDSSIAMLKEADPSYVSQVLKRDIDNYLREGLRDTGDKKLEEFVVQLFENQIMRMDRDEKIRTLVVHAGWSLEQLQEQETANLDKIFYDFAISQSPNVFNRQYYENIFLNAEFYDLPVLIRESVRERLFYSLKSLDAAVLNSYIQVLIISQLKDIALKIRSLGKEYENEEEQEIASSLERLAFKIECYTNQYALEEDPNFFDSLNQVKQEFDAILSKQSVNNDLDGLEESLTTMMQQVRV